MSLDVIALTAALIALGLEIESRVRILLARKAARRMAAARKLHLAEFRRLRGEPTP